MDADPKMDCCRQPRQPDLSKTEVLYLRVAVTLLSAHYITSKRCEFCTQKCENNKNLLAFWFKMDIIVTFGAPITDIKQKKDVFPWSPFPSVALHHCCSEKRKKAPAIVAKSHLSSQLVDGPNGPGDTNFKVAHPG